MGIHYLTYHHDIVMIFNHRMSKIYQKMFSQEFLIFIIFILLHNLLFEIKAKNTELVMETKLSHSYLKENSTTRQICYQRLEMKSRLLDVGESQLKGIDQWLKNVNEAVSQVNQEIKDLQTHIISASKND